MDDLLILLVDPDPDARSVLTAYLQHHGYRTVSAATADEGFRLAVERRPDLIVGEHPLHLPDGTLLCETLGTHPLTSSTPFLAVTASAMIGQLEGARRRHAAGVLAKPIAPSRLLGHIHRILGQTV